VRRAVSTRCSTDPGCEEFRLGALAAATSALSARLGTAMLIMNIQEQLEDSLSMSLPTAATRERSPDAKAQG